MGIRGDCCGSGAALKALESETVFAESDSQRTLQNGSIQNHLVAPEGAIEVRLAGVISVDVGGMVPTAIDHITHGTDDETVGVAAANVLDVSGMDGSAAHVRQIDIHPVDTIGSLHLSGDGGLQRLQRLNGDYARSGSGVAPLFISTWCGPCGIPRKEKC